jgi:hypothetical protein
MLGWLVGRCYLKLEYGLPETWSESHTGRHRQFAQKIGLSQGPQELQIGLVGLHIECWRI